VLIGVRPEDFVPDESGFFEGTVTHTEALGEVTLLYVAQSEGAEPVVVKRPGVWRDQKGAVLRLAAVPDKVHLFADGVSLLYR
jgi:alpha-glucoside transport system ATP-binding protein